MLNNKTTNLNEAFETNSHHFESKLWLIKSRSLDRPEVEGWSDCVCFYFTWAEGPNLGLWCPEEVKKKKFKKNNNTFWFVLGQTFYICKSPYDILESHWALIGMQYTSFWFNREKPLVWLWNVPLESVMKHNHNYEDKVRWIPLIWVWA